MEDIRTIIRKYAFDKYLHSGVIALIDIVLSVFISAFVMLCVNVVWPDYTFSFKGGVFVIIISTVASIISIFAIRTHHIIIRHSTLTDIWKFGAATLLKEILFFFGLVFIANMRGVLLASFITLDALSLFCGFICIRMAMVVIYDTLKQRLITGNQRINILIYGVDIKSTALKVRLDNSTHYKVVGFIGNHHEANNRLLGLRVFSFDDMQKEQIKQMFNSYAIQAVLFPNYNSLSEERDQLIAFCTSHKVKVLVVPPIDEIVDGKIAQNSIREIKIEDLLGRDEIKISMKEIIQKFSDKSILVTGAAGSIGSELCRQLASFGIKRLIMFDNAETPMHNIRLELEEKFRDMDIIPIVGDVRQRARLDYLFSTYKPQIVFHAAAYKHVPLMEENPCEALLVNVDGSRNVADFCVAHRVEMMVMISTDKAVNPTNVMGCSKRLAEIYVQSLGRDIENGKIKGAVTKFVTTRFGNVLGSNGSVIPRFREQILKGGPVTVTHPEITRFFMTIPEACRLVMEAATMSVGNQIFVFDMGKSVKIVTLAERMIELAGFTVGKEISIKFTGLRPGEKLYEEVLSNAENTSATQHEKIRIASVREYDYNEAVKAVDELKELAERVQIMDAVKKMKDVVPEFKSRNSRFEELDEQIKTA